MYQNFNERLGLILIQKGLIKEEQLREALKEAHKKSMRIDNTLVNQKTLTESQLLPVVAQELDSPHIILSQHDISQDVLALVSAKYAQHFKILPVKLDGSVLQVATNNPSDLHYLDEIKLSIGRSVTPILSSLKAIEEGIKKYYGIGAATVEKMLGSDTQTSVSHLILNEVNTIDEKDQEASVISFVNQILNEAVRDGASDIHIEPFADELRVRYRIDGVLYKESIPPSLSKFYNAITSRIKIMANLDIAERRLPQDGRIKIRTEGRETDLRVSILPTPYGETVNIRILAQIEQLLDLEALGLNTDNLAILKRMIYKPHGIIFVTGPTGSGKTTTLYASLTQLNNDERKILTIEDPIEYLIKGITQMQINPKIDLTFGNALRHMLRHDPDVMMVGEVRDFETAEITIRVSLTGHMVLSTLHTNDAPSAVTRLMDMGIEPFLITSSVECIIAQRLARKICTNCKIEVPISPELRTIFEKDGIIISKIYDGRGCAHCKYTGYRGRTAIYEFIVMTDHLRTAIMERKPASILKEIAKKDGMKTLRQDGWLKVKDGITTAHEIFKVTQEEEEQYH